MNDKPDDKVLFDTAFSHYLSIMHVNHESREIAARMGIKNDNVVYVPLNGHPTRKIAFIPEFTIAHHQYLANKVLDPLTFQHIIQEAKDALATGEGWTDDNGCLYFQGMDWDDEDEDEDCLRTYYPHEDLFVYRKEEYDRSLDGVRLPGNESRKQLWEFKEVAISINLGPFDFALAHNRFLSRAFEEWARKNARGLVFFLVDRFILSYYDAKRGAWVIYIVVDDEIPEGEKDLYEVMGGIANRKSCEQGFADIANMPTSSDGQTTRRLRYAPDVLRLFFREFRRAVDYAGRWLSEDKREPDPQFIVLSEIKWDVVPQDDEWFLDESSWGYEGAAIAVDEGSTDLEIDSQNGVGADSEVVGDSDMIIEAGMLPEIRILDTIPPSSTQAPVVTEEATEEEVGVAEGSSDVGGDAEGGQSKEE